jgi:hypothetical protein
MGTARAPSAPLGLEAPAPKPVEAADEVSAAASGARPWPRAPSSHEWEVHKAATPRRRSPKVGARQLVAEVVEPGGC